MINSKYFFQGFKSLKSFDSPALALSASFIAIGALLKNLGFSASYRTSSSFTYESTFAIWDVPQYSALDAQVSYKIENLKTILKLGGNNIGIGSGDYRTRPGGPYVGKLWYLTLTFDEFLN